MARIGITRTQRPRRLDAMVVPATLAGFTGVVFGLVHMAIGEPGIDVMVTAIALLPVVPLFSRAAA